MASTQDGPRAFTLTEGQELLVGRRLPADMILEDARLSRLHARLRFDGHAVVVEDLGSRNGTFVAGRRIPANSPEAVLNGQEVLLGDTTITLHCVPGSSRNAFGAWSGAEALLPLVYQEIERARLTGTSVAVLAARSLDGSPLRDLVCQAREALGALDQLAIVGASELVALCPGCDAGRARRVAERWIALPGAVQLAVGAVVASRGPAPRLVAEARALCSQANAGQRVKVAEPSPAPGRAAVVPAQRSRSGPVAVSAAMRALLQRAERAARAPVSVLIVGETGAGKEVAAQYIHACSPRAKQRIVTVNCGALPETLLSSTLFGHARGAFTGASGAKAGLFEQADGGTLFLDEIGELSLDAQVSLLRVLETRKVTRVGCSHERAVDVRIVAATHRDLAKQVADGLFREDLWYRLNAITLRVPPLRERRADIPSLVDMLLGNIAERWEIDPPIVSAEVMGLLERYAFPGNVRELRNLLEHALVAADDVEIRPEHLPEHLPGAIGTTDEPAPPSSSPHGSVPLAFRQRVEAYEGELIKRALEHAGGNQTRAAQALQIPRRTLVHKLRAYRISGSPDWA